ncbi:probable RNA methyltransferase CG1239 isoform X1 [Drosophila pseudoobscura]|uniref:RNA methyltransferase n=2 Tax=pseudoobscura subgroup TaxID=32358 RepID=A0A6I8VP45_DROPS|nr:probable RNA methyltransferase CG1239 isoform X1 [Drosophila pseudoobscura]XP_033232830.1 probable RNA methyltransferase CG1239 isoform X1 [Drosophila pseudoobscura]
MEVENNNNTQLPANTPEKCPEKRKATFDDKPLEIKRLKEDCSEVETTPRPPPQSPKKRLQLDGKPQNNRTKRNKDLNFLYGNYKHYYGKRILDKDFHDIRLDVLGTQPELFRDKQLLDIGCNSGHLSIEICKKFNAKSLVGLDIDRGLVKDAQMTISSLKHLTPPGSRFPYNVKFLHGNYVLDDDVLLEIERPQFDVILCLSVTKWIHLNFCDAGLKQAFRRMFLQLRPDGKLILEPQSFDGYRRRKKISENIRENYNSIKFRPDQFPEYLLSPEVGFASMELMGIPEHCKTGFKRPIQIFKKV